MIRLGGRELLFSIIHDISERKRAEEQLRFTASVFEHAHEGIMITDANAQIVDVNRTFTEITGYAREDVLGRSPNLLRSGYTARRFTVRNVGGFVHRRLLARRSVEPAQKRRGVPRTADHLSVRPPDGRVTHYGGVLRHHRAERTPAKLERMAHYDAHPTAQPGVAGRPADAGADPGAPLGQAAGGVLSRSGRL